MAYTAKYRPSSQLDEENTQIIRKNYEGAMLNLGVICNILKKNCGKSDIFHKKMNALLLKMAENHTEFFEITGGDQ